MALIDCKFEFYEKNIFIYFFEFHNFLKLNSNGNLERMWNVSPPGMFGQSFLCPPSPRNLILEYSRISAYLFTQVS